MTISSDFQQGVDAFNQQDFYHCHDILEALWIDAAIAQKQFYQGILQIAVGCYHLSNGNSRGAQILLGEGIRRLQDYQPHHDQIDVAQLIDESAQLLSQLHSLDEKQLETQMAQLSAQQTPLPTTSPSIDTILKAESAMIWPRIVRIES